MFTHGGISAERVISSKQKGKIEINIDAPYIAGVRFYFDTEKIANDGMLTRDGAHVKVKKCLPLEKYLIWIATPDILRMSENTTPRIFAEKSDAIFFEKFSVFLPRDTCS